MILVDGYQDGMLSRTTTISGGRGCNDLRSPGSCDKQFIPRARVLVRSASSFEVCDVLCAYVRGRAMFIWRGACVSMYGGRPTLVREPTMRLETLRWNLGRWASRLGSHTSPYAWIYIVEHFLSFGINSTRSTSSLKGVKAQSCAQI